MWAELDTVVGMAARLKLPRSLVLSRGLLSLRPPPGATPPALRPGVAAAPVVGQSLPVHSP